MAFIKIREYGYILAPRQKINKRSRDGNGHIVILDGCSYHKSENRHMQYVLLSLIKIFQESKAHLFIFIIAQVLSYGHISYFYKGRIEDQYRKVFIIW